jgi:hypothetical protein
MSDKTKGPGGTGGTKSSIVVEISGNMTPSVAESVLAEIRAMASRLGLVVKVVKSK